MDWIQGDKFESIGHFTFAPSVRSSGDYSKLPNTFSINSCLQYKPCIIYTHNLYVKELFKIIEQINHKFIIVTHNCDINITFAPPLNVIKWYSQNVNIRDNRIESIPIGIENDRWAKVNDKKGKMLAKLKEPRQYKNLVYMNHNIKTNPSKRQKPYDILHGREWVTTRMGANGDMFDDYIDNIYNHKFVICPEGNGIDTHRIWECLYMGTIPIVENNINNSFYSELPMLTIDDWSEITEEKLWQEFIYISVRKWNMDMLTFEYWRNKILNKANNG